MHTHAVNDLRVPKQPAVQTPALTPAMFLQRMVWSQSSTLCQLCAVFFTPNTSISRDNARRRAEQLDIMMEHIRSHEVWGICTEWSIAVKRTGLLPSSAISTLPLRPSGQDATMPLSTNMYSSLMSGLGSWPDASQHEAASG